MGPAFQAAAGLLPGAVAQASACAGPVKHFSGLASANVFRTSGKKVGFTVQDATDAAPKPGGKEEEADQSLTLVAPLEYVKLEPKFAQGLPEGYYGRFSTTLAFRTSRRVRDIVVCAYSRMVDDDAAARYGVRRALESEGYRTREADSGERPIVRPPKRSKRFRGPSAVGRYLRASGLSSATSSVSLMSWESAAEFACIFRIVTWADAASARCSFGTPRRPLRRSAVAYSRMLNRRNTSPADRADIDPEPYHKTGHAIERAFRARVIPKRRAADAPRRAGASSRRSSGPALTRGLPASRGASHTRSARGS